MQSQQQTVVSTTTPQQHAQANGLSGETLQKRFKVIRILGIVEVILGIIMIGFGIYTTVAYNYWEGIGNGIWVIIAGGLGIGAGGRSSTPCLINSHMGFSIIGAISSAYLAYVTGVTAVGYSSYSTGPYTNVFSAQFTTIHAVMSIMCFIACLSAVILLVSAFYCCISNPLGCCGGCCGGCCERQVYPSGPYQQQVVYANTA